MAGARAKYSSDGTAFVNIYGSTVGAPSLYQMPSLSTCTAYIGRYTASSSTVGATVRLHLCFSAGYNGQLSQMIDTYVNFCFGNGSGTLYNCWVDYRPAAQESFLVRYKVSGKSVDFYVVTTSYFGQGYYVVSYATETGSWIHSGTKVSEQSGLSVPTTIGNPIVVSDSTPTAPDCILWV